MKTCPRCGVENKAGKAACWNCWAPLEGPAGGAVQAAPSRRRLSIAIPWTAVAVVALVAVAAGGVYFFLLASKPADVALQFLLAVRNGNDAKRDRLATKDTSGQAFLPSPLLIAGAPQVDATGIQSTGGQADVPASVELTVDPMKLGIERAVMIDETMQYFKLHPVRQSMVLVKQGMNWRVDQDQTRRRFLESSLAGIPFALAAQLQAAGMTVPGLRLGPPAPPTVPGAPAPGAAPPGAPAPTPAGPKPGATPAVPPRAGAPGLAGPPKPGAAPAVPPRSAVPAPGPARSVPPRRPGPPRAAKTGA